MSLLLYLIAIVVGPASAVIYWLAFSWRGPSRGKTWAKALPMGILFAWLWMFAEDVGDSPIPWVVLFAWLGDIALSKDGDRWFLAGMASFGLAHLFLIAVFFDLGMSWEATRWPGVVALQALAALMALILWRTAGALRAPVLAYLGIICAMGLSGLTIASGSPRVDDTVLWGLGLFILSDTLLALQVFVAPKRPVWQVPLSLAVWPTYYLAMVSFAAAAPG